MKTWASPVPHPWAKAVFPASLFDTIVINDSVMITTVVTNIMVIITIVIAIAIDIAIAIVILLRHPSSSIIIFLPHLTTEHCILFSLA